jgi:hypothetical protein
MGLPIQQTPEYRCTLSNNLEVRFRPFLVKEQKYLLVAAESSDSVQVLDAIVKLIDSVTFGSVDTNKLSMAELEYLFLNIRAKSVGENIKMNLYCTDLDCDGNGEATVNLDDLVLGENKAESRIQISEEIFVDLKVPTAKDIANAEQTTGADQLVKLACLAIDTVYDSDTVYNAIDFSPAEITEFVESLTVEQMEKIKDFLDEIPTVTIDATYVCDVCNKECTRTLRGMDNFF